TALVGATKAVMSRQSAMDIAGEGLRSRAAMATAFLTAEAASAIGAGRRDLLDALFTGALDGSGGDAVAALAVDAGARPLAVTEGADLATLGAMAEQALAKAGPVA